MSGSGPKAEVRALDHQFPLHTGDRTFEIVTGGLSGFNSTILRMNQHPTRSRHASFTSIFPKFSPLKSLRKALGAFSMPSSTLSFHTSLPSRIHPDRSRWNSGRRLK